MNSSTRREFQSLYSPREFIGKVSLAGAVGAVIGLGLAEVNHLTGNPVDLETSRLTGDLLLTSSGAMTGALGKLVMLQIDSVQHIINRGRQSHQ